MADKKPSKPTEPDSSERRKRDYIKKMMKRPTMKRPTPIKGFKTFIHKRRPAISEVVREPTAGGIVFRRNNKGTVQFLLIQDAKDRWTIPKGHIEPGEDSKTTAKREITEETGLEQMDIIQWLGKINFRYRRITSLVLMTTEIFLVRAKGDTDKLKPEDWMNDCKWLDAKDALDKIEYEDIGKLMLVALTKIRKGNL
ncbi:MAG: NUDIX domain-containing protein [bacterium]|nr:NUDIX domain-containing protein [bacterium]